MKKTILALAALAAGVSASAQEAAKSSALAVTLDVSYVSAYVFRGVELAEDSIQPSVEASYGDFYAGIWHSDDVNSNAGSTAETDFYVGYNYAINETFSADLGVTRYTYDDNAIADDSTEAYVGIKADVALSPSLYYFHDFDNEVNTYIASIGHTLPIEQIGLSLDLSATYGYVQIPGNDYSYWGVGVALPYSLSETATLTTAVNYTHADTRNPGGLNNDQDQLVFSVGLAVGF